jgi:hypothetical protein
MNRILYRVLAICVVYGILKFMGGSLGQLALYPVTLLVTFLHEFGHAIGALITGGEVRGLQINHDGSGVTTSAGGNRAIILMGGYLGSAIFGNLLFYIGAKKRQLTQMTLYILSFLMAISGLIWFETLESTALQLGFAVVLAFIAWKTDWDQDVLMFLGLAAVLYIIQDFNVGPKSDLAMYEEVVGILPASIWMYFWLIMAGGIFAINLKGIFSNTSSLK